MMTATSTAYDERLAAGVAAQRLRLEKLSSWCVGSVMLATLWMMIPDLHAALLGSRALLPELGPALLMLAWAFFMQDLIVDDARSNSQIGGFCSVIWLPLLILGSWTLNDSLGLMLGGFGTMAIGALLYRESRKRLVSGWQTIRYRAVMGGIGLVMGLSFVIAESPHGSLLYLDGGLMLAGLALVIHDSVAGDEDRDLRKEFRDGLKRAEVQLLQLKSEGVPVDQASSLVTTASEEGHLDPKFGLRLLHEALDDIERTTAMAGDVEDIRADAYAAVEAAEDIAPLAKRPRSALVQGDREVELGSLREGELLYRQAKNRSAEVIEWWAKAEKAIGEAQRLIADLEGEQARNVATMLNEAKEKLAAEKPKKAWEFAIVIPEQVEAVGKALGNAEQAVEEAKRVLAGVDGLDTSDWQQRMSKAQKALDDSDHSLARGLSDSVIREIEQEREAMEDVRRAMRQRNKLKKRWKQRPDAKDWQARYDAVEKSADKMQWSHAATLLQRLTDDLDKESDAAAEAQELLVFVKDEWRSLRNQLEASGVKVKDEQRRLCEAAVGDAGEAHGQSRWEDCLKALGKADDLMERLRRRV